MARYRSTRCRILINFRMIEQIGDVVQGTTAYARAQGLNWLTRCVDIEELERNLDPSLVDGLLLVASRNTPKLLRRVKRSGIPAVNLLHDVTPLIPSVLSDDESIGRLAAQHLQDRGFRSFAFVGFDSPWSESRQRGFETPLVAAGMTCNVCPEFQSERDYARLSSRTAAPRLGRWVNALRKPVGVMACSDVVGSMVLDACCRSEVRVPEDVAVIGVDNVASICESATSPLTSVAQDVYRMSFDAARMLDRLIGGRPAPVDRKPLLIAPRQVVTRRSTEAFAFGDPNVSLALKMIHEHRAAGTTMKEILAAVPVSRRWLDQRFTELVGHPVSIEIRKARLAHVSEMLLHSDLMVKQIAARSGFSSGENMTRFFRSATGFSPEAYRKSYLNAAATRTIQYS